MTDFYKIQPQKNSPYPPMKKVSCLSQEELEYYLQVCQNPDVEIQKAIEKIKQHLSRCLQCREELKKIQLAYENKMYQRTIPLQNTSPAFPARHKAQMPSLLPSEKPNIVAGCQLLERIGGGAMGEVYKALKISLNRIVAVKVLNLNNSKPGGEIRFQQEAVILAQVDHPNVTQVYDYFVSPEERRCYLVMQYIHGEDLEKHINRCGPVPPKSAGRFLLQLLEGLYALHRSGIIHRDLKPSNILIDQEGRLKIADFGLAKSIESELYLTMAGSLVGTPHYMSPEACQGYPQSYVSDIYSLGAVFYSVLTGRTPFQGQSTIEILNGHLYAYPHPPSTFIPHFPEPLERIIFKMMAKDYYTRYQTCAEIIADFHRYSLLSEASSTSSLFREKTPYPISPWEIPNPALTQQNFEVKPPTSDSIPLFQKIEKNSSTSTENENSRENKSTSRFRLALQKAKMDSPISEEFSCEVCQQVLKSSVLVTCECCQKRVCEAHQMGLFCQECYQKKNYDQYAFYLPIFKELTQKQKEIPSQGKLNFTTLSQIFDYLSYVSKEGLLFVENSHFKKGVCFFETYKVAVLNFGGERTTKLGHLLLQDSKISEQQLTQALKQQKESHTKLGEILVAQGAITTNTLNETLQKQVRKDIFELPQWEGTHYKFKEGLAANAILSSLSESSITLPNASRFKNILSVLFQHLSLIFAPGIFFLHSPKGSIGLLVSSNRIELVNFEPKEGFQLREALRSEGALDSATLEQIPPIDDCLLDRYLIQTNILPEFEIQKTLQRYVGKEILRYLKEKNYTFEFIEGELSPEQYSAISTLPLGLDLKNFIFTVFEKTSFLSAPISCAKIFTLLFEQTDSVQMKEILLQQIYQTLPLETILNQFNDFEATILSLVLLKSSLLHFFQSLQKQASLLIKYQFEKEAGRFLDVALDLL